MSHVSVEVRLRGVMDAMAEEASREDGFGNSSMAAALRHYRKMVASILEQMEQGTKAKKPGLMGGRAEREADSTSFKIKPNTHCDMVLLALRRQPMSAAELQWELRIADARAAVRELKLKGYRVEKDDHPNPNPDSRCRTIQRYRLVDSE